MICFKKKSRGHEELWRFDAGVCLYLCLMGYTDQSGIRLWQHLTLAVHCCMSCVVPIRINNNINNTHLCDLAVYLLKEKNKTKTSLFALQTMFFDVVMKWFILSCFMLVHVWIRLWNLGCYTHSEIFFFKSKWFSLHSSCLSTTKLTLQMCKRDHWQCSQLARRYFSEFPVTQMGCHFTRVLP